MRKNEKFLIKHENFLVYIKKCTTTIQNVSHFFLIQKLCALCTFDQLKVARNSSFKPFTFLVNPKLLIAGIVFCTNGGAKAITS